MRYTLEYHKKRLKKMLEKENVCTCCPAQKFYMVGSDFLHFVKRDTLGNLDCCTVCQDFVDATDCPCQVFGKEEAIKRSFNALKKSYAKKG